MQKIKQKNNQAPALPARQHPATRRQDGVTLLLAIIVLASLMAITFSLATILFIEQRNSADLLRTETSIYAANGLGEQALFNLKRQVCTNNDPSCLSSKYSENFQNNVTLPNQPVLTSTSTPIFTDNVPANTGFSASNNKYDFCNVTAGTSGCGYGKVRINYISTGSDQNSLIAYLCQYDPNAPPNTYPSSPCSTLSSSGQDQGYWLPPSSEDNCAGSRGIDGGVQITANTNPCAVWDLTSSLQQELVVTAPSANANVYFSVETYGPDGVTPLGLPYVGETSVVITTQNGPVGRRVQVLVPVGNGGTDNVVNYALNTNGASALSSDSPPLANYPASSAITGNRSGSGWGSATGGWENNYYCSPGLGCLFHIYNNTLPQSLEVDFSGNKTIHEIDVFTLQDNYASPADPTPSLTFSLYGITNFQLQYDNSGSWTNIPGASTSNNNLVWTKFDFAAITTDKIRLMVNDSADHHHATVTDIEAY